MENKTIKILVGVIIGFAAFIILLFLISSCSKREYTYEQLEKDMYEIGKEYYTDEKLPKEDGEVATYKLDKMIENGKIKQLKELFNNDKVKCDGEFVVENNNGLYLYTTKLDCGSDYKTTLLTDKIMENSLVENGVGLYKVDSIENKKNIIVDEYGDQIENIVQKEKTEYVMKGEVKNNYILWKERLYRIIKINDDGSIRVIETEPNLTSSSWDNRYNINLQDNLGYNTYVLENNVNSRIKQKLENYYNDEESYTNEDRKLIKSQTLCIGSRSKDETINDGSVECSKTLENQQFGLLTVYEYINASLEKECKKTKDTTCTNYNWLASSQYETWLLTTVDTNDYQAYYLNNTVKTEECRTFVAVLPVFNLSGNVKYSSGTGTKLDPYIFEQ